MTKFEKKVRIVGRVSMTDPRINFGKLFRAGELTLVELEDHTNGLAFPYKFSDETNEDRYNTKVETLKLNWEEDKRPDGYGVRDIVWGTYSGCTDLIITNDEALTLKVTVYDGGNFDETRVEKRITVTFTVNRVSSVYKALQESVDRAFHRHAEDIRYDQIQAEEAAKVSRIKQELLGE